MIFDLFGHDFVPKTVCPYSYAFTDTLVIAAVLDDVNHRADGDEDFA